MLNDQWKSVMPFKIQIWTLFKIISQTISEDVPVHDWYVQYWIFNRVLVLSLLPGPCNNLRFLLFLNKCSHHSQNYFRFLFNSSIFLTFNFKLVHPLFEDWKIFCFRIKALVFKEVREFFVDLLFIMLNQLKWHPVF